MTELELIIKFFNKGYITHNEAAALLKNVTSADASLWVSANTDGRRLLLSWETTYKLVTLARLTIYNVDGEPDFTITYNDDTNTFQEVIYNE